MTILSLFILFARWACFIKITHFFDWPATQVVSAEEEALEAAEFLHEDDWKKTMVDCNAVVLMSIAMFFWGFYAW